MTTRTDLKSLKVGNNDVKKVMLWGVQIWPMAKPVLHYDAIDNAGTGTHDLSSPIWKDLAGNNDATISFGDGSWGNNGLVLDKTLLTFPTNGLDFSNNWTMTFVVRILTGGNVYPRFNAERTFPTLYVMTPTTWATGWEYRYYSLSKDAYFLDAQWNHVKCRVGNINYATMRRTGNSVQLFIDWILIGTGSVSSTDWAGSNPAYLAGRPSPADRFMKWTYHSFRFYNEALTDWQILAMYNEDKARFN